MSRRFLPYACIIFSGFAFAHQQHAIGFIGWTLADPLRYFIVILRGVFLNHTFSYLAEMASLPSFPAELPDRECFALPTKSLITCFPHRCFGRDCSRERKRSDNPAVLGGLRSGVFHSEDLIAEESRTEAERGRQWLSVVYQLSRTTGKLIIC